MDMNFYDKMFVISFGIGGVLVAVFFSYATYLTYKWLPSVEMTMSGQNVFTQSWFFAIHAVILYGSIFTWDWHARRQKGRLERIQGVPKNVRLKFIISYLVFIIGCIIMFCPAIVLEITGKI